jgi:predicted RNA binding protein YcfA (HicA-like mRNA interferase family)
MLGRQSGVGFHSNVELGPGVIHKILEQLGISEQDFLAR